MQQIAQFFKVSVCRNICDNLARLGVPVTFASAVGGDAFGQMLLSGCRAARPRALPAMIFLRRKALRLFRTRPSLFRPVSAL